jgi:3-oxoacyl-[acyl-carrier-protein] synthase-3
MNKEAYKISLYLPSQAAAETEAIVTKWKIAEGETFEKGQLLAEIESAKSVFEFEAPCAGTVISLFASNGDTVSFRDPVMEVLTDDPAMKNDIFPAGATPKESEMSQMATHPKLKDQTFLSRISHIGKRSIMHRVSILGIGGCLPERIVTNRELIKDISDTTEDYIFGVTGIRERRWAKPGEKPSDLAYRASIEALRESGVPAKELDAIILATTTPDVVMPSTACILQNMLGVRGIPAFDINAACSGWLYGISVAKGLIFSDVAENVLVVGVDMQSRLLDTKDKSTYFLFCDGAGATVVSGNKNGHTIKEEILLADAKGLHMARREFPGYMLPADSVESDPYVRLDGHALFRFATESFSSIIRDTIEKTEWKPEDITWVIPHQANGRILKAAATRCGIPFERFYINIDHVGNTSSASIPLALSEMQKSLKKGDKIILCSVGSGITAAAISIEW